MVLKHLPGIVIWLPAFQLKEAEEAAGHVRLVLTGAVDKTSLGHLHDSSTMSTTSPSSADNTDDGGFQDRAQAAEVSPFLEPDGDLWTSRVV